MQTPALKLASFSHTNLGHVTVALEGKAKIIFAAGRLLKVYAQASHVPALHSGDEVLFIETEKGVYIVACNLQPDESPALHFQHHIDKLQLNFGNTQITLTQDGEICLRNENAQLTLTADGVVEVAGKELKQFAENDIHLAAKQSIHLNSET